MRRFSLKLNIQGGGGLAMKIRSPISKVIERAY